MQPSETARSYDILAQRWQERTWAAYGIAQFERAIKFVKTRGHALDIGCGSNGRIIDLLLKHGFQIEGIDVSEKMIELATSLHPDVSFAHADICEWKLPRQYDFICAWDSIWHLPLEKQEPVMQKICQGLKPDGVFIFTTVGFDQPAGKTDSNMGPPVHVSFLGIPNVLKLLDHLGCVCRHLEYDQYPEMHLYVIAQKKI